MRCSFFGLSEVAEPSAGSPEDADIALATVRATEASALCTRQPCAESLGSLQDGYKLEGQTSRPGRGEMSRGKR